MLRAIASEAIWGRHSSSEHPTPDSGFQFPVLDAFPSWNDIQFKRQTRHVDARRPQMTITTPEMNARVST